MELCSIFVLKPPLTMIEQVQALYPYQYEVFKSATRKKANSNNSTFGKPHGINCGDVGVHALKLFEMFVLKPPLITVFLFNQVQVLRVYKYEVFKSATKKP